MRKLLLVLLAATALALPATAAAATFTVTPTTVRAGVDTLDVELCGMAAGASGYVVISGPAFGSTGFFGPLAAGCTTLGYQTAGWPAGRYRSTAYQYNKRGQASRIGSASFSVV